MTFAFKGSSGGKDADGPDSEEAGQQTVLRLNRSLRPPGLSHEEHPKFRAGDSRTGHCHGGPITAVKEPIQRLPELSKHAKRHDHAGNVWQHPACVTNH